MMNNEMSPSELGLAQEALYRRMRNLPIPDDKDAAQALNRIVGYMSGFVPENSEMSLKMKTMVVELFERVLNKPCL